MAGKPSTRKSLRPTDLAREHGLSTQAVRNYEDAGILPPAARGPQGYRRYTEVHAQALRTFLALRGGYGHQPATDLLRAANARDQDALFRLIDAGHARLARDRATLDEVARALGRLATAEPPPEPGRAPLTVGDLAHRLDVHPATLRKWEQAGILHPRRDPATGYRRYDQDAVRDAHLAHQLRRGGYLLNQITPIIRQMAEAGGAVPLEEALAAWRARLAWQSRAMLTGAAQLSAYLELTSTDPSSWSR